MRTTILKAVSLATVSAYVLSGFPAIAQDKTFQSAKTVYIEGFIGDITVVEGEAGAGFTVVDGNDGSYAYELKEKDGDVLLAAKKSSKYLNWSNKVDWRSGDIGFEEFLEDYPKVTVSVAPGTNIRMNEVVATFNGGDVQGAFSMRGGYVTGRIGDVEAATIRIDGSNDFSIGDVAGPLTVSIHGSGDVEARNAGRLAAEIHGSGDVTVGAVEGSADASVHGSGDVEVLNVGGDVRFEVQGSGDIATGAIGGGVLLEVMGSGDVAIDSVSGPTKVAVRGSGDVAIGGGEAKDLTIEMFGSGDFALKGVATNADIDTFGSGLIDIARHQGGLNITGTGTVVIAGAQRNGD